MVRHLLLSTVFLTAPTALWAQAPVITPAGDPSVRADTIYALAVNPADYTAHGSVLLLDDGVMRIERDGTSHRTFRTVVQVLKQDAAREWGQWNLRFRPDRERLTVNWVRVLRADGTLLSDRPQVDHETQESVDENHVYSGRTVRQLTLGGVAAGTIVDLSYTLETVRPTLPGDFSQRWFVNQSRPVRRMRFILDAPARQRIAVETPNLTVAPAVVERGGRTVRTWSVQEIPALDVEPLAAYPNDVLQEIRVWGWAEWTDIGDWYARLSHGRDATSRAVDRAFAEEAGAATDVEDLLRAAQRWVSQDFRYVSVGLGDGNYQPRLPSEVVESRYGDCKDKTALFIALARSMDVVAYPVLVNTAGLLDSTPVSLERFDHVIVALERNGKREFLDLTYDLFPYGTVPPQLQGTFGLLVRPRGESRWIRLPESPVEENWIETLISGTLGSDGTFRGTLEMQGAGTSQYGIREQLRGATLQGDERMMEVARDFTAAFLPGAIADSTTLTEGLDLTEQPYIGVWLTSDRLVQPAGERFLLQLPSNYFDVSSTLASLKDRPRRFPIDASELNDASTARVTLVVNLPPGWRAELPPSVSVDGLFGRYRARYTQKGRTLRAQREMTGRRGTEPPDSVNALLSWLSGVAADRAQSILVDPTGGGYRPGPADIFMAPTRDTGTVAVRFGWPAGMEATVEAERIKIAQTGATPPDTQTSRSTYRLSVQDHPDGRLISFSDWATSGAIDTTVMALAQRLASEGFVARFAPALVVGMDGTLLRLAGFDAVREVLDSTLRPLFDSLPNPTEARTAFLNRVLSEDFLLAKQAEEWNALVWSWSDVDFEVGAVYEHDANEPSPVFPDQLIPFHYESSLLSRVPCVQGVADSACVSLVIRSVPDPEVLTPFVIRFLKETMGMPDSVGASWHMEVENVIRLVTEPETLMPHRLEMRQKVNLTGPADQGAEPTTQRQTQIRRFVYRYPS